ncbi:MAG TPA: amylo-alpha-1,6-glucosidase, partial [Ktedonobacteraceae bacterium]|nr:amylo-alpha-1,6-glucosidase [Ktedonobacteraceae bacterium]
LWNTHAEVPIHTSDPQLNRLFTRGTYDLMMLTTMTPQGYYPYAGIPLFSCPFGRDGLISALEFLPWYPQIARGTLEFLAAHQGTRVDPFTDEEPGKILHEYRTGEMANCREIPYIPYYGSVDATALFLITLDAYLKWSNDRELLERLWPNAQAAAQWLLQNGQHNGDTFIRYHRAVASGLANQGWKDSHDSASYGDGELAPAPLALCEVQAYTFAAYRAMSTLAQIMQHPTVAAQWDRAANALQENFLRRYWWAQEQTFYMALDGAGRPCDIVTSNAGQCLWSGIVPKEHAHHMIARLMRKDMFSGWGIRTLSTHARRYNPLSYHNGSVWPHDTALVGLGFAQYGAKTEVAQLLQGLRDASDYFEDARLPELYCGFARQQHGGPIRYAEACSPQAWSAGSPHLLLQALLGFQPHAQEKLLVLQQPTLPDWLTSLEVRGLHVGGQKAHLRFVRVGERTEIILGQENEVAIRIV